MACLGSQFGRVLIECWSNVDRAMVDIQMILRTEEKKGS